MAARKGSDPISSSPERLWTVDEANRQLEELRELLPQLKAWVVRLRKIYEELHRLSTFWGKEWDASDNPDRELRRRLEEEWGGLTRRLEDEIGALQGKGIEVKDLESGLVDFYSVRDNEVVFLCWQRGEEAIGFYHTLAGGYRSRRPLDQTTRAAPKPRGGV